MSTTRLANQKKSTEAFIDGWRRLSIDDIVNLRAPDCIQHTIPKASLQVPDQTNDQWVAALTPAFASLKNFKVSIAVQHIDCLDEQEQAEVHSVTHDAESGRSIVHADTSGDAPWGDYRNTHVLIFSYNEDGTKMIEVTDMMDSAGMIKRMELIKEWQGKH